MVLSSLTSILFVFDNMYTKSLKKNIKNDIFFLNYATANLT